MSTGNNRPLFTSAPRLKLYIDNVVVGYAIGFNINLSVDVQPIYVIGEYRPVALEPTMYNIVTGTMQIVRLRSKEAIAASLTAAGMTAAASTAGNEVAAKVSGTAGTNNNNSILTQSNLFKQLDPSKLMLSQAFNVAVHMRVATNTSSFNNASASIDPQTTNTTFSNGIADTVNPGLTEVQWMEIKNCRITSRNTNITMGQLVNEPVNFQGLLAVNYGDDNGAIAQDNVIKQGSL